MSKYITVQDFAAELRVSQKTVRNWVGNRRITIVKIGRSVRIPLTELERLEEEGQIPARRTKYEVTSR